MSPAKRDFDSGFSRVDETDDPTHCIRYLDTFNAFGCAQGYKHDALQLLQIQPGDAILDVGCGTGDNARELSQHVGRSGRVVGLDNSRLMIIEATKRAAGTGLPVEYEIGDVCDMDLADETFHKCVADRVFQHLADPRRALAEMARVTRPGGRILVVEPDYETLIVDSDDRVLTRRLLNFRCDEMSSNGWIGRQLPALFVGCGLRDIVVQLRSLISSDYATANSVFRLERTVFLAQQAGLICAAEGETWLEQLKKRDQSGQFFCALTFLITMARKPESR